MSKVPKVYDLIIIGAAGAGLSAAIYASRRGLSTLVLSKDLGGQASITPDIENYPGVDLIEGWTLMQHFERQAKRFGAEIIYTEVVKITKQSDNPPRFTIKSRMGDRYESRSLLLAFGKTPKNLNVPGEKEFTGKGVSYCATCDAPLFTGKKVAVIGGGNSALDTLLLSTKIASHVIGINRRDAYRGEAILEKKLMQAVNKELISNADIVEIKGDKFVTGIVVKDIPSGQTRELAVDGVFVEIGYEVNSAFLADLVELNERHEVVIDPPTGKTSNAGVWAAGDLVSTPEYKQLVISAGQGAVAALSIYDYLMRLEGKQPVMVDWGAKNKSDIKDVRPSEVS